MIELILGGARSGKSRLAEQRAGAADKQVVYIATAQARDPEMAQRIQHHQGRRSGNWLTLEEPVALAKILRQQDAAGRLLLVDCLTLWLSNLLSLEPGPQFDQQRTDLLETLPRLQADVILVSNETGLGVVPTGELTRRFVDESGWLHQTLASLAQRVTLVVAGLPMALKPSPGSNP
ncbi:MAG: bifunctional adenosylcobinamide kinase/adenosylcobinamide-phosphate guanylyltransferase [Pseudomonadales bacterium]|nr:bifunctional adenosylcobinamide kinase/adenosylcobinamide-phosphate guanylyltransferase [Pseudomonadales bacterium]